MKVQKWGILQGKERSMWTDCNEQKDQEKNKRQLSHTCRDPRLVLLGRKWPFKRVPFWDHCTSPGIVQCPARRDFPSSNTGTKSGRKREKTKKSRKTTHKELKARTDCSEPCHRLYAVLVPTTLKDHWQARRDTQKDRLRLPKVLERLFFEIKIKYTGFL